MIPVARIRSRRHSPAISHGSNILMGEIYFKG
jgi:hypothetical protein